MGPWLWPNWKLEKLGPHSCSSRRVRVGNWRILVARGCVRQGVPLEEILTMLPWILSRRRWERKANPGAEDQKRSRRKRRLHLVAWLVGWYFSIHSYFYLLLGTCWVAGRFCWAGIAVSLGGHCFLAWGAHGSFVLGIHASWHLTEGGWQGCLSSGAGTAASATGKTWLQEQISQRHEPDPRRFSWAQVLRKKF